MMFVFFSREPWTFGPPMDLLSRRGMLGQSAEDSNYLISGVALIFLSSAFLNAEQDQYEDTQIFCFRNTALLNCLGRPLDRQIIFVLK
jgi:hypothetical protein